MALYFNVTEFNFAAVKMHRKSSLRYLAPLYHIYIYIYIYICGLGSRVAYD